jgi:hypothetical protein
MVIYMMKDQPSGRGESGPTVGEQRRLVAYTILGYHGPGRRPMGKNPEK